MNELLPGLARAISASRAHELAAQLLSNVPALPPVLQTVHLLGIGAVVGSVVLINVKLLGLGLRSQSAPELVQRLMPWTWWALAVLFISGLVFILARPQRYLLNPIFGWKLALLVSASAVAFVLRAVVRDAGIGQPPGVPNAAARVLAAASLLLWLGVVMAGRWIAYVDYLFPE